MLRYLAEDVFQISPSALGLRMAGIEAPDAMRNLAQRDATMQQRPLS
jgi:hypothetical protein